MFFLYLLTFYLTEDVPQMFMDEAGHYFYQSVPGQQQMVVMTSQGSAEVDNEGNVVSSAATPTVVSSSPQVMLHATDPLTDVRVCN